ncbi:hypothetical protein D3C76_1335050 [compost metagenome]
MITNRVHDGMNKVIGEMNERGMLVSTACYFESVSGGVKAFNRELDELFLRINSISINLSELKEIENILSDFLEGQYNVINEKCKVIVGDEIISRYDTTEFLRIRRIESESLLSFYIKAINKRIHDKRRNTKWDIYKLVLSALLGASLSLVIKWVFER